MRSRKGFTMGKGKYYFVVKSSPNNITMHRIKKEDAVMAYRKYCKAGKNCEWLGLWDGKKFQESNLPAEE